MSEDEISASGQAAAAAAPVRGSAPVQAGLQALLVAGTLPPASAGSDEATGDAAGEAGAVGARPAGGRLVGSSYVSPSGAVYSRPFRAADADATVIYGRADLGALRRLTAGSGQVPLEAGDGKGIVALWVMEYQDTNLGPYHELVLTITTGDEARRIPWRNPFTAATEAQDPRNRTYIHKLLLDNQDAIDYGIDVLGVDKKRGALSMETVGDRRRFEVRDGNGALVVRGAVPEGDSIMERLRAARGVVAAQGILPTVRMLLDPEAELTSVTTDVKDGHTPLTIQSELRSRPRLSEIDRGDLEIGGDSDLGSLLRSMHFEPSLAYRDPDLSFTMHDAQPSRTPPP